MLAPKKSPPALTWQQQLKWLIHWTGIFNGQSPNLFVSYLLQQIVSIRMIQHRKRNQLKLRLQQHQQHQPGFISQVSADGKHREQPHSLTHWLVVLDSLESWDFLKSKFSKTIKKRRRTFLLWEPAAAGGSTSVGVWVRTVARVEASAAPGHQAQSSPLMLRLCPKTQLCVLSLCLSPHSLDE